VEAFFELAFNPGTGQRLFTNGQLDDDIDQNPAAEGR
jgi:endo-beta-N-acetylglucosaminidase D